MKNKFNFVFLSLILVLFAGSSGLQTNAQTVNVTMTVNTSTCLDTLRPNSIVLLCGASKLGTTVPKITWDTLTGIRCTNIGGDYWQAKFQATAGDEIQYKFVTYTSDLKHPTFHWTGWEGPLNSGTSFAGTNRGIVVSNTDMNLPMQYYNGWESTLAQYWTPFRKNADTLAVYFRVNMGGVSDFNPASQTPEVWGSAPLGASPNWVKVVSLSQEKNSVNKGSFWSGTAYVPKALILDGTVQSFKFTINGSTWESISDRSFKFTNSILTASDTTINWAYFNNRAPSGPAVTGNVNFRLKLDALEKAGLFNRGLGDKIAVTGAKGWPPSSFTFDTEPTMLKMTYVPTIQEWILTEPFTLSKSSEIIYKYYIAWDTTRFDTTHANYIPGLFMVNGWEEPGITGGGDRIFNFPALSDQTVTGDFGADQQFFNSLHPNSVIGTPIDLTFNIDMIPATNATTNPTNTLFRPGIDTVYIQFDGCLIPITQHQTMYGTDNRIMLTSPNADGKYTATVSLNAPTFYQVCYRITYTSSTGEVMNGGGTSLGRRYYQYIVPTSVNGSTVTWPSSFSLAEVPWMQNNLTVENPPNLGSIDAINENIDILPNKYALYQNYPNPFNPSTVISYSIMNPENVKLEVFNIVGEKVATLSDQHQTAGVHSVVWNSMNENGVSVNSGVYLLKIQAGSFSKVQKMLLLK